MSVNPLQAMLRALGLAVNVLLFLQQASLFFEDVAAHSEYQYFWPCS